MAMQFDHFLTRVVRKILRIPGKHFYKSFTKVMMDALHDDIFSEDGYSIKYTVETKRGSIDFFCIGEVALRRAKRALLKEPSTIKWIETFKDDEILWDIGANVGVYSLYAGINRKNRVISFEPSAANYYLLSKNIEINGLGENLTALCLALNDHTSIDTLNLMDTGFGAAESHFATTTDFNGDVFKPAFKQGVLGFSVDEFIRLFSPPFPNHIKIDVDGTEGKIIQGASKTLADRRLKSMIIELKDDRTDINEIREAIKSHGFQVIEKICLGNADDGEPESFMYNYLFRRD